MNLRQLVILAAFALPSIACGRTVTPAELDAYESRSYAGYDKKQVLRATVTALRSLGYEVVAVDDKAGRVKTAPKLVVVHAARTSSTTAVAVGDSIAWTVDVSTATRGASVHAEPRLYSSGQAVEATRLNHDYADRTFKTLYSEIESNLAPATTSADLKR
jgi:hypothetical protein